MRDKKIIIILFILGLVFTILGGTLAYWNWQSTESQKMLVTFTVTPNMSCSADGGGSITNEEKEYRSKFIDELKELYEIGDN